MTKAIVLLSGGIDSALVLALALANRQSCHAISFDYNQRHSQELKSAKALASHYGISHQVIRIDAAAFGNSSLVENLDAPKGRTREQMIASGIPNTYVPARNTLFLAYALGQCEIHGATEIHFGPNQLDHACYPDCRPAYLNAFQHLMQLATKQAVEGQEIKLITPLLHWNKGQIIAKALALQVPLEWTWSCYSPTMQGTPCQACDACHLRAEGFVQAQRNGH